MSSHISNFGSQPSAKLVNLDCVALKSWDNRIPMYLDRDLGLKPQNVVVGSRGNSGKITDVEIEAQNSVFLAIKQVGKNMLNYITIVRFEVMFYLVGLRGKDTVQTAHCALAAIY